MMVRIYRTCMLSTICVQFYEKLYLRSILRIPLSSFHKKHRERNETQNRENQFSAQTNNRGKIEKIK